MSGGVGLCFGAQFSSVNVPEDGMAVCIFDNCSGGLPRALSDDTAVNGSDGIPQPVFTTGIAGDIFDIELV